MSTAGMTADAVQQGHLVFFVCKNNIRLELTVSVSDEIRDLYLLQMVMVNAGFPSHHKKRVLIEHNTYVAAVQSV